MSMHFINTLNQNTFVKENYDYTTNNYKDLYQYSSKLNNKKFILTSEPRMTASNILAVSSNSDTKILYISKISDNQLDILKLLITNNDLINELGIQNVDPNNVILLGLTYEDDELENSGLIYLTEKKLLQTDTYSILQSLIDNSNVHLEIDDDYLNDTDNLNKLLNIFKKFKNNIISLGINSYKPSKIKGEIIKYILRNIFDIVEKKINVFNEHSEFLIYRPVEQTDSKDIGWYIMRGIDLETKNKIMSNVDADNITTINIDDDDYYITKTNIDEQNSKSYFVANSIIDTCLFPQEKIDMLFELIN